MCVTALFMICVVSFSCMFVLKNGFQHGCRTSRSNYYCYRTIIALFHVITMTSFSEYVMFKSVFENGGLSRALLPPDPMFVI